MELNTHLNDSFASHAIHVNCRLYGVLVAFTFKSAIVMSFGNFFSKQTTSFWEFDMLKCRKSPMFSCFCVFFVQSFTWLGNAVFRYEHFWMSVWLICQWCRWQFSPTMTFSTPVFGVTRVALEHDWTYASRCYCNNGAKEPQSTYGIPLNWEWALQLFNGWNRSQNSLEKIAFLVIYLLNNLFKLTIASGFIKH